MIDELNAAVLEAYAPVCSACGKRYPECRDMRPASCLPDAVAVEDEIARRGLWEEYASALLDILGISDTDFYDNGARASWQVLRATSEQRCRAALAIAARQETR